MKDVIKVEMSPQVKVKMAEDPDVAEAVRSMLEVMNAAAQGVAEGRYPSFDEAMFQLTGDRPRKLDEDEAAEALSKSGFEDDED